MLWLRSIHSNVVQTPVKMLLWLIIATTFAYVFYKLWKLKNFWKDRHVPSREPVWFFGDLLDNFLRKKSFIEIITDVYHEFSDRRYAGFNEITTPVLLINDPDLIKQICMKDFDHFPEHQTFSADSNIDPLWDTNLFASRAAKWRELRPLLSPAFTTSKIKLLFVLMDKTALRFVQYFKNQNENSSEVELKDIFTRFTNDVIATTAFGIECDSLQNRTNEFYLMGKSLTDFTGFKSLKIFAFTVCSPLMKILGFKVFPKKASAFFINTIDTTIKERKEKNIIRPDILNLLLQAQKNDVTLKQEEESKPTEAGFATVKEFSFGNIDKRNTLSDVDLYAQCLTFFFAGFETVANALTLTIYELALNKDIQDRLREEIDEVWQSFDKKLNYEALTGMKYMDMVVSESLRKWSPSAIVDRRCVKRYVIPPVYPNEKQLEIEVGQVVGIPIHGIHSNEKYFPQPHIFDPERFSDKNKSKIKPGTYMPFGNGPRNCIGSRFALLEIKTLLFHLLREFVVVPNTKTQIPLICSKSSFSFVAENGTWVDFKKRQ